MWEVNVESVVVDWFGEDLVEVIGFYGFELDMGMVSSIGWYGLEL